MRNAHGHCEYRRRHGLKQRPHGLDSSLGCVSIDAAAIGHDLYEEHFQVTCRTCGRQFHAREVLGYHYPWWEWRAA